MQTNVISRETLSSRVCSRLREEILSGSLRPGERLNELGIAERLGISPTPVREAMRLLVNDGLVEYVAHKGMRVITLSEEEILQAFSVRRSLERLALTESMPRMTRADKERLLELAENTSAAAGKPASVLFEIDRRFHGHLVECSRNPWLLEFSGRMINVLTVARLELFQAPSIDIVTGEHIAIAAAVMDGDHERADRALDEHIRRVCANAIATHKREQEKPGAAGKEDQ